MQRTLEPALGLPSVLSDRRCEVEQSEDVRDRNREGRLRRRLAVRDQPACPPDLLARNGLEAALDILRLLRLTIVGGLVLLLAFGQLCVLGFGHSQLLYVVGECERCLSRART